MRRLWRTPLLALATVASGTALSACTAFSYTPTPLPAASPTPQPTTSSSAAKPTSCSDPLASYAPSATAPGIHRG